MKLRDVLSEEPLVNDEMYSNLRDIVNKAKASRNWDNLPFSFEYEKVKRIYDKIKVHLKDTPAEKRKAGEAQTFDELLKAINQCQLKFGRKLLKRGR